MTDFLLELRSEEIPARMQARARDDLARLFAAELARAGLAATDTVTYATPRRLALILRGLPDATEASREEVKGPPADAPDAAVQGFLRKLGGVSRDVLETRPDAKGRATLFAVMSTPGRATVALLPAAIEAVIRAFPWPKSMRWGAASAATDSLRWVRPLHGIVALFGDDVVPVEIAGVTSGAATLGHRFHHPGPITIGSAGDYAEKLRACHVIVDHDERATLIRDRAHALAAEAGLELIDDEGLVAENAGLTEWPVPLLGRFDEAFLDVPPEVIQLTARVNQKYFVCRSPNPPRHGEVALRSDDGGGAATGGAPGSAPPPSAAGAADTSRSRGGLANVFICTANIDAADGGAKIVEGNRKVLAARLSDARFFYEQDRKVSLEEHAKKLDRIVFHEKLGTVADKVDRVAKLARWLVEEGIVRSSQSSPHGGEGDQPQAGGGGAATRGAAGREPPQSLATRAVPLPVSREDLAALAERAARLAKADLVTGMVGEFPELQGVMGGYYALAQGEDPQVAAAIRDHYKPVGQGDEVPTAPVTVAVSLADKLDTFLGFFLIGEPPTGSKDPFALRRATLAALALEQVFGHGINLGQVLSEVMPNFVAAIAERELSVAEWPNAKEVVSDWLEAFRRGKPYQFSPEGNVFVPNEGGGRDFYSSELAPPYEYVTRLHQRLQLAIVFRVDRLKVQQREAGVRHDLIDAVFAAKNKDGVGEDDLVRLLARVRALQAFMATEDGANLLTGYRRAANILKKEGYGAAEKSRHPGLEPGSIAPQAASPEATWMPGQARHDDISLFYTPEPAEEALANALDAAEPNAAQAVAAERFEDAMAALASLRAAVDRFFDEVTVNDPDPAKRTARLALLARIRDAVHTVGDFSKIEGA